MSEVHAFHPSMAVRLSRKFWEVLDVVGELVSRPLDKAS
jgi:hypothetical protein